MKQFVMIMTMKNKGQNIKSFWRRSGESGVVNKRYTNVLFKLCLADITNVYQPSPSWICGQINTSGKKYLKTFA